MSQPTASSSPATDQSSALLSRRTYFTRSSTKNFKAAGVLPFACAPDGEILVLLGAEQVRTGPGGRNRKRLWKDFGGKREAVDADAAACAAREFAEESLGLFGGVGVDEACVALSKMKMESQLRAAGGALRVAHPLRGGSSYVMFLAEVPFLDPLMFDLATAQNSATGRVAGAEKSAFAWVSLRRLLEAVGGGAGGSATASQQRRRHTCNASHACGRTALNASGGRGTWRPLRLHPCFVSSVRLLARASSGAALAGHVAAAVAASKGGGSGMDDELAGASATADALAVFPCSPDLGPGTGAGLAAAGAARKEAAAPPPQPPPASASDSTGAPLAPEHLSYWLALVRAQGAQGVS